MIKQLAFIIFIIFLIVISYWYFKIKEKLIGKT